ncbi:MAG: SDR family NAD(P)-dependent oxidoreductase, partial [Gammaproteobacteria bacterium]|nr:SDR family NAD(P)-dependent oxidoreductase [Gammaproteobacteria bacterium]
MSKAADWINLSGKVAHVTGGARGIGRGISRALALAGAKVMVSDLRLEDAQAIASEIGGDAMVLDVTDRAQVDAAMAETRRRHGSLDILVNNAGVYIGYGGPVRSITDEMWK